jgi:hypothetical protein
VALNTVLHHFTLSGLARERQDAALSPMNTRLLGMGARFLLHRALGLTKQRLVVDVLRCVIQRLMIDENLDVRFSRS